jgi:hypothetical protein
MRVCATSRRVTLDSLGRRASNTNDGRTAHSCRLNRVMGSINGRGVLMTVLNASRKEVEEQAQKSNALSFGREQSRVRNTSADRSSSICSCARNSLRSGVKDKHCRSVCGVRSRVWARSRGFWAMPMGLKWEKSRHRTMVPRAGCEEMCERNLRKVRECRMVI